MPVRSPILNENTRSSARDYILSNGEKIPDNLRCPISLDVLDHPVVNSAGQTYSHAMIGQHIEATRDAR